jgi:hypothetical protein
VRCVVVDAPLVHQGSVAKLVPARLPPPPPTPQPTPPLPHPPAARSNPYVNTITNTLFLTSSTVLWDLTNDPTPQVRVCVQRGPSVCGRGEARARGLVRRCYPPHSFSLPLLSFRATLLPRALTQANYTYKGWAQAELDWFDGTPLQTPSNGLIIDGLDTHDCCACAVGPR